MKFLAIKLGRPDEASKTVGGVDRFATPLSDQNASPPPHPCASLLLPAPSKWEGSKLGIFRGRNEDGQVAARKQLGSRSGKVSEKRVGCFGFCCS